MKSLIPFICISPLCVHIEWCSISQKLCSLYFSYVESLQIFKLVSYEKYVSGPGDVKFVVKVMCSVRPVFTANGQINPGEKSQDFSRVYHFLQLKITIRRRKRKVFADHFVVGLHCSFMGASSPFQFFQVFKS